jgi:hypothetical protein
MKSFFPLVKNDDPVKMSPTAEEVDVKSAG